jgi:hypothetical protein
MNKAQTHPRSVSRPVTAVAALFEIASGGLVEGGAAPIFVGTESEARSMLTRLIHFIKTEQVISFFPGFTKENLFVQINYEPGQGGERNAPTAAATDGAQAVYPAGRERVVAHPANKKEARGGSAQPPSKPGGASI